MAETLNEDGRLLKMFVMRNTHLESDARERATRDWLIRESFYERWLEEFIRRYAPSPGVLALSDEDALRRQDEISKSCEEALRSKHEVDRLEQSVQEAKGDVHQLRDTLMAAVNDLLTPKKRPGRSDDPRKMTPEAIEAIKMKRQQRLRSVVYDCLQGIWRSGVGGEVLKFAMDTVQKLINKFEVREDDVRVAASGASWFKLKELVSEIEGELPATVARRRHLEVEGRGTKHLIQKALDDLGGRGTTAEILQWVQAHPEVAEEHEAIRLNKNIRDKKGHKYLVWHSTMRSILSTHFAKSREKREDGVYLWFPKGTVEEEAPRILDSTEAAGSDEQGQGQAPGQAPRRKRKALKPQAASAAAGAHQPGPEPRAEPLTDGDAEQPKEEPKAGAQESVRELEKLLQGEGPSPKRPRKEDEGVGEAS